MFVTGFFITIPDGNIPNIHDLEYLSTTRSGCSTGVRHERDGPRERAPGKPPDAEGLIVGVSVYRNGPYGAHPQRWNGD